MDCRACKLPICRRSVLEDDHIFLSTHFPGLYWKDDFPAAVDLEDELDSICLTVGKKESASVEKDVNRTGTVKNVRTSRLHRHRDLDCIPQC